MVLVLVLAKGGPRGCCSCLVREEVKTKDVAPLPGVATAGGAW